MDSQRPRRRLFRIGALAALVIVGAGLRLQAINTVSYWFDESCSWKTIQMSFGRMLESITGNVHPPAFYVLARIWSTLCSDSPASLRVFSIIFGLLTILAAYWCVWLARSTYQLSDAPIEFFAAVMICIHSSHIFLSQQARMYSMGTFLTLVVSAMTLQVFKSGGSPALWIGTGIASVLWTMTHYYCLLTATGLAFGIIALLLRSWFTEGWSGALGRKATGCGVAFLVCGAAWSSWIDVFMAQRARVGESYWIQPLTVDSLTQMLFRQLIGNDVPPPGEPWSLIGLEVWIAVPLLAAFFCGEVGVLSAFATIVPLGVAILCSLNGQNILVGRYLIFPQTMLLLSWALLVGRIPKRSLRAIIISGTMAAMAYGTFLELEQRDVCSQYSGLRTASLRLNELCNETDVILVASPISHVTIQRYARFPRTVYVKDIGRPYSHFQAGSQLQDREYLPVASLDALPLDRFFAVDVYDLFGQGTSKEVVPSTHWRQERAERFEEAFGHPCTLVLREYRRHPIGSEVSPAK